MRLSKLPFSTLKETPADAELASHRLMLRAGLIRPLGVGLYVWLPLGFKVAKKVEQIVREEMDAIGSLEMVMPLIHPAELWQESGRWDSIGPELLRMQDRHGRDLCFAPTHEEVITDIARRELKSYKQLPVTLYHIQYKFRDERRPRFGVMRSREFIMKDAYSFHLDYASLQDTYDDMHRAYTAILNRLDLTHRAVQADSGNIGGAVSHEFHVLADSGEDAIVYSDASDYAANLELAEAVAPAARDSAGDKPMEKVHTPAAKTIAKITALLGVGAERCVKTLLVQAEEGADHAAVALVVRGDHELNRVKAEKIQGVAAPLTLVEPAKVHEAVGSIPGYLGPAGLPCPVFVDRSAAALADFVCGANEKEQHLVNANWHRDIPLADENVVDIRNVEAGDPSPDGKGNLRIERGIEVGHIFQLGTKYSESMGATVLNEKGKSTELVMGCYGVGITRMVAAAIEQSHDERGIIWPDALAPFDIGIVALNWHKSQRIRDRAEKLYSRLRELGYDPLLDDRDARPGFKFADLDLLGIPHRLVLTEKGMDAGEIEYKGRRDEAAQMISLDKLEDFLAGVIRRHAA